MHEDFHFPEKDSVLQPLDNFFESSVDEKYYYNNSKYFEELSRVMTRSDTVYQWRRVYVRENKNGLCPTLTANMGTGGHNVPLIKDKKGIRKLTPKECLRLQGFDEDYILPTTLANSALYKQVGNSVSVPIVCLIANEIQRVMTKNCLKEEEFACL